jgi:hypothetical protein
MAREVCVAVPLLPPDPRGLRGRVVTAAHTIATEGWVRAAATGRLGPPFAITGELPNGTPALDRVVLLGEGGAAGIAALGKPMARVVGAWLSEA